MRAAADVGDYDTTLDRLSRLQALARSYVQNEDTEADPIVLTLAYTRVGNYNTDMWTLTAGARDPAFETYVNTQDGDLQPLQDVTTVTLPNGENIDFGHLLASMNLVYNGIPITGSWGGDCMELAKAYYGQASDAAGYASAMRGTFNMNDDGTNSVFGDQDLHADLDSVIVGSTLKADTDIAETLRSYYADLTDYDRASTFIRISFGTVDTSAADFGTTVYNAMMQDSGMQLLLYVNGMWQTDGWQIKSDYAPALQGAAQLLAEYLSGCVNGEKIKSDTNNRLISMGSEALAAALSALGDNDAASQALVAGENADSDVSASSAGSVVGDATRVLQQNFNANIFRVVLLVLAALAVFMLIMSAVMFVMHRRK